MSFSTKLVDYFAAGKCIFAIGDKNIAPILYLKENDAAIIASTKEEIFKQLNNISSDANLIRNYSKKSYNCGKLNHDKNDIDNRFVQTMILASKKEIM